MNDVEVFNFLFEVARKSKDPRGITASCLVDGGKILSSAPSADDGIRHSEDLLFEKIVNENVSYSKETILYCTLEPCSKRRHKNIKDCTTLIIDNGIKKVVYGAKSPDQSHVTGKRFEGAGVAIRQANDPEIIKKCAEIFNDSVREPDVELKPME